MLTVCTLRLRIILHFFKIYFSENKLPPITAFGSSLSSCVCDLQLSFRATVFAQSVSLSSLSLPLISLDHFSSLLPLVVVIAISSLFLSSFILLQLGLLLYLLSCISIAVAIPLVTVPFCQVRLGSNFLAVFSLVAGSSFLLDHCSQERITIQQNSDFHLKQQTYWNRALHGSLTYSSSSVVVVY